MCETSRKQGAFAHFISNLPVPKGTALSDEKYEIDKNTEKGNGLVVVKLDSSCCAPNEAFGIGAKWVNSFDLNDIKDALDRLANKRYAYN